MYLHLECIMGLIKFLTRDTGMKRHQSTKRTTIHLGSLPETIFERHENLLLRIKKITGVQNNEY